MAVEALKRLKGVDLNANPALKAAVMKVVESTKGTPQFVELIREFALQGQSSALLSFATDHPDEAAGIDAVRLVLSNGDSVLVQAALTSAKATNLIRALGLTSANDAVPLLESVAVDSQRGLPVRSEAVRALALTRDGAEALLRLAKQPAWPAELSALSGTELRNVRWPEIKAAAASLLPALKPEFSSSLPPIHELSKQRGNVRHGEEVFFRETVGCSKCHQVSSRGIDFGPNLTEIGTKLAREAIYEAILDPSAGISFGYEAWQIELKSGDEAFGLIASETADELAIKAQGGILTRYRKTDILRRTQQKTSVMPSGLAETLSRKDLIDLVEFLVSLKKQEEVAHQP